jgi:putative colanic acid biosynthesis acetyltransferase WcaB
LGFISYIRQDSKSNARNTKGKLITLLFRTACFMAARPWRKIVFFPYLVFYKFFVEWVLGTELPWGLNAGPGLSVFHGQAIVINKSVRIGENCTLRQSTTIGNSRYNNECPVIGNNVDIGCNVCIIGPIHIGNNVIIGAGSVVIKDVPSNTVVVGNPARVIKNLAVHTTLDIANTVSA